MLYIKNNMDGLPEVVELFARFRAQIPSFACPTIRSASRLQASPASLYPAGQKGNGLHALAYEDHTASWCFFSEEEAKLWSALSRGLTYQDLRKQAGGWRATQLRDFLVHLYQRGLLAVDGKPSLDPKIYARGPLFGRAYLVEILLTERCNLACRYCYARGAPERAVMPMATLRRTVDLAMTLPTDCMTIQFAGGETFTHFSAFKKAVAYIEEAASHSKKDVQVIVQSNGTLLARPGVVDFLREHDIRVGVSIEGPCEINDLTRNYVGGRSSHHDTLQGLEAVRKGGLTVVGTLTVVSRHNVDRARELLEFFTQLGVVGVRFNVILAKGRGGESWGELGITPREYFEFMKTVIRYIGKTRAFQEANLQHLIRNLIMRTRNFRCMRSPCGAGFDYLVITPEGDVYPCVHWLRESRLRLGNVRDLDSLEWAFLHSSEVKEMADRIVERIPVCRRCEWRHLCEGGCGLAAKDHNGKLLSPSPLCEYYRNIYPFLFEYLSKDPELATFLVPQAEVCRIDAHGPRGRHDLASGSLHPTSMERLPEA
jgi:uncharacterized protein